MDRAGKFMGVSLLLIIVGFVMEILSILMFYGHIWTNICPINGGFNSIWPILEPAGPFFCIYRPISTFYFPFFVFGIFIMSGAITLLAQQSTTQFISNLNMREGDLYR